MEQKPEEKAINLPVFDELKVFMDDKTGMAWVGIPTARMNAIGIMLVLDYVKMNIVNWAEATRKTRRPGLISGARESLAEMVGRLQGLRKP